MPNNLLVNIQWVIIVILIALLAAPYLVNRPAAPEMTSMGAMMQKMFPLDNAAAPVPTVSFTLTQGAPDGWYLHIITTNFTFTPEKINTAPVADEGHAHLYIDGKLTVVMGPWFHIPGDAVSPGKHTVMVSLNANDHSVFANNGQPIEAMQTLYSY